MTPDPTASAAAIRIVKLLVGTPPQTVTDLVRTAGVTRTAVTEQLAELAAAGFVRRTLQRHSGRGRPRYVYSATEASLELLADCQRLAVPAIWQAVLDLGGDELIGKIVKRAGQILAENYKHRITARKPAQRMRQMAGLLAADGALVEVVRRNGQPVLYKRSCPFISMRDPERMTCTLHAEMMSCVLGCTVRHTACRFDGAPCCMFEIAGPRQED